MSDDVAVHPAAAIFPMLPNDELQALADDIATNGLLHPILVDPEGAILDGRNRHAACLLAEIDPVYETYHGDPIALVVSANIARRHMTTGQRAMATALTLADNGHRANGRWRRGDVDFTNGTDSDRSTWKARLAEAGVVLDHAPDLAPLVVAGTVVLSAAVTTARQRRAEAESEQARMDRLDAAWPDLAAHVRDESLTLTEAEAAARQRDADREDRIRRNAGYLRRVVEGWQLALTIPSMVDLDDALEQLADDQRAVLATVLAHLEGTTT